MPKRRHPVAVYGPGDGPRVFAQPCQSCGHPEAAHLELDEGLPTGTYRGCSAEGCSCRRWRTPWPKV